MEEVVGRAGGMRGGRGVVAGGGAALDGEGGAGFEGGGCEGGGEGVRRAWEERSR